MGPQPLRHQEIGRPAHPKKTELVITPHTGKNPGFQGITRGTGAHEAQPQQYRAVLPVVAGAGGCCSSS